MRGFHILVAAGTVVVTVVLLGVPVEAGVNLDLPIGESSAGGTSPVNHLVDDAADTGHWTGAWDHGGDLDWDAPTTQPGQGTDAAAKGPAAGTPAVRNAEQTFEPRELLALNLSPASLNKVRQLGFSVSRRPLPTTRLVLARVRVPESLTADIALAKLRKIDPDGFYDLNPIYRLAGTASPRGCGDVRCYGQTLVRWDDNCAVRSRIGMIDSAINGSNPALKNGNLRVIRLGPGAPTVSETEHGTAVAALLVGAASSDFPGLLPGAELVAADVFTADDAGNLYTNAARLAAGLDWVASQDAAVINISVTGADSGVVHTVIHRLSRTGIVVVAAAGNAGPDAAAQYPAAYDEVLAVTAVDSDLNVYGKANRGSYVALAAPGVDVWTAGPDGGVFREGTSFAAPFVTAAVAVLRARTPGLAPAVLLRRLRAGARDLGPPGRDPVYGSGLLQVGNCSSS